MLKTYANCYNLCLMVVFGLFCYSSLALAQTSSLIDVPVDTDIATTTASMSYLEDAILSDSLPEIGQSLSHSMLLSNPSCDTTVYAVGSTSVMRHLSASSWSNARSGSGGSYDVDGNYGLGIHGEKDGSVYHISHTFFTFNTLNAIPSDAHITSASVFVKPVTSDYNNSESTYPASPSLSSSSLDVSAGVPTANSTNWLKVGSKLSDTVYTPSQFYSGIGVYQEFSLSSLGTSSINLFGKTNFALVPNNSYLDSTVPVTRSIAPTINGSSYLVICYELNSSSSTSTSATSTEAILSSVAVGLDIIIVLLFIVVLGFMFNNLNDKKPWQH